MHNVRAITSATGELNMLLSFFSSNTDRDSLELAMRADTHGAYQLMDKSPLLPDTITRNALNLGLRLGFCQVQDRIGQTLFLTVFRPGHAAPKQRRSRALSNADDKLSAY